jgi:predicted ribosome quality control (RQC) complex YloA/Tae2 family protein
MDSMLIIKDNEIVYRLGRNAKENFELIDEADQNDWWFHLSDHPSGHCIIDSSTVDKSMIIFAGNLVKEHSKLKNQKNIKIIYTQIKNITKTKTLGQVIVKKYEGEIIL